MITINNIKISTQLELNNYLEDNNVSLEIDEAYNDMVDGTEYIEMEIVNPENEQKLITMVIDKEDAKYHEAKKELTWTTNNYEWTSILVEVYKSMDLHLDYNEDYIFTNGDWEDDIKELNGYIDDINQYGDIRQIEDIHNKSWGQVKEELRTIAI